jgi:1-acyl-sn-glycerol-3-phosphate acyltransferase
MYWLGGISIDRRKAGNTVEQMRVNYEQRDNLELIITPEGTRSKVREWKSGFYRIAKAANVPIVPAAVHAPEKVVIIGDPFYPTGDYEADLAEILKFYEGKVGFCPDKS